MPSRTARFVAAARADRPLPDRAPDRARRDGRDLRRRADERSGRTVAVKKILPHIATDPDFLDRFFHEIRIQISLKHPNLVELVDCSPTPDRRTSSWSTSTAASCTASRKESGRFPWEIALFVGREALTGLAAAHAKGVVHRDIKPQNIMWTSEGGVKIGDFGISHADASHASHPTGTVVGTPAHMSPEQARGEELDARTDLFSTGTVLYELLCGYNPFTADSIAVTLRRVADAEPELPSLLDPTIPPGVDSFLRKLHAKDRNARFPSAEEASRAARAIFEKEKIASPGVLFRTFLSGPRRVRRSAQSSSRRGVGRYRRAAPEGRVRATRGGALGRVPHGRLPRRTTRRPKTLFNDRRDARRASARSRSTTRRSALSRRP